jgi:hypothetical protein
MDAGVTGGAKSHKRFRTMLSRPPVMHMNPPWIEVRCSAALAAAAIPEKNLFAVAAEAALGIPEANQANAAQVGAGYLGGAAWTKESALGSHLALARKRPKCAICIHVEYYLHRNTSWYKLELSLPSTLMPNEPQHQK